MAEAPTHLNGRPLKENFCERQVVGVRVRHVLRNHHAQRSPDLVVKAIGAGAMRCRNQVTCDARWAAPHRNKNKKSSRGLTEKSLVITNHHL